MLEIVGTGGDNAHSFNISTTSAMVVASAGVPVAKHGNRAASSRCGAADCLEALGVNLDQPPQKCVRELEEIGLCFMFAQKYHASMKYVAPIRKELGIRTVFNILGPLTNPAHPTFFVLGVYDEYLLEPLAAVLTDLGVRHGLVVYGQDCLDEISVSAPTSVLEFRPEDFGFRKAAKQDIVGGLPTENARYTLEILRGVPSPKYDIVMLNAGAAIYIGGKAASIAEGVAKAKELVASGAALEKLEAFRRESNR